MSARSGSSLNLGLRLAATSSPKVKAAKRMARLRVAGPGAYLWVETEQEFGMYRNLFPKPEDVCTTCLKAGNKQTVTGRFDYVDGWGTKGWVRTCPVHGTNPPVKQYWAVAPAEKRIVKAIALVIRVSRSAAKGTPPVREVGWVNLQKALVKTYTFLNGRKA